MGLTMNIGNAYRRARNALCYAEQHFAVTVQLDDIKYRLETRKRAGGGGVLNCKDFPA